MLEDGSNRQTFAVDRHAGVVGSGSYGTVMKVQNQQLPTLQVLCRLPPGFRQMGGKLSIVLALRPATTRSELTMHVMQAALPHVSTSQA